MMHVDGRMFQIAGTTLSDGTTIIPFSAITLGEKPATFPVPITGVSPPVMFLQLEIVGESLSWLMAMSLIEYNQLAIALTRMAPAPSLGQTVATTIKRVTGCRTCGGRR